MCRSAHIAAWLSLVAAQCAAAAGPEVRTFFPSGAQRGTTVELAASGNFPKWPAQAWFDRAGVTATATADKGKLNFAIATDAEPGLYWLRLFDAESASAPRPLVIGLQPELVEQEPNNAPSKAQAIPLPIAVVNGRLANSGDVDLFSVELKRGQTLVAALDANTTLGSPMDSAMQIVGPRGTVVGFNHDQRGLDPRIEFVAPADGRWTVRVFAFPSTPNSTIGFAGGEAYVYRLTLATGGYVDYGWPLAITRDRETRVELIGWNVPESLRTVTLRGQGSEVAIFDPQLANLTTVAVEPHETLIESEPNDVARAQVVAIPATVSGRIDPGGDVDVYSFSAAKGDAMSLELVSRALGFPLDAVLEVTDATGKSLARVDDAGNMRDPVVTVTAPADGELRAVVRDLNQQGSSRHAYRLRIVKAVPDFDVTADNHAYTVVPGKPTEIALAIARRNGFAEEIDFVLRGAPETITAAPVRSGGSGDTAAKVTLVLNTAGAPFSGPVSIEATSAGASKLSRTATWRVPGLSVPLRDLWLTSATASK